MNFLAYKNRGDSDRIKFWNGSHLKTKTGIFQVVEAVGALYRVKVSTIQPLGHSWGSISLYHLCRVKLNIPKKVLRVTHT